MLIATWHLVGHLVYLHVGHHVQLHVNHFFWQPCRPPCPPPCLPPYPPPWRPPCQPPCRPPQCRLDALWGLRDADRMEIRKYHLRTNLRTDRLTKDKNEISLGKVKEKNERQKAKTHLCQFLDEPLILVRSAMVPREEVQNNFNLEKQDDFSGKQAGSKSSLFLSSSSYSYHHHQQHQLLSFCNPGHITGTT